MSKMAELEYEQRMAADQLEDTSQLEDTRLNQEEWETIRRVTKKAEAAEAWAFDTEYELWGRVFGTHGGRLSAMPIDPRGVWPDGTALYVKVKK
jgi:hypothetical protein